MKPIFVSQRFRAYSKSKRWKLALKIILGLFAIGIIGIAGLFLYVSKDLPNPNSVNNAAAAQSTKIYDRTGQHLLYDIHGDEKRTIIPVNQIPDNVKYATIALEDQNFYSHHGIVFSSIIRSAFQDIIHGGAAQGGSTITQQLVKNSLLSDKKTVTRKIKEVVLALEVEQKYSKDDILGMYLNNIPYGSSAYGIEAAAQTFFGKSARDLTLPEAALLAALPNAPTYYSPYGNNTQQLKVRQELALDQMKNQGYITQQQDDDAKQADVLSEIKPMSNNISAPHFVMYVKDYLVQKYGEQEVEEGGLNVTTTLDWNLQQDAEQAITTGAAKNDPANKAANAALVAIDPKTGQILAMVGSKNYFGTPEPAGCTPGKNCTFEGNFNVATSPRQPGSSFKPYVYLTAFTKGYTPETSLWDVPTNFSTDSSQPDYTPQNYDGKNHGQVQMKDALAESLNVPAVKTLYLAGVQDSITMAKNLGITGLNDPQRYGLSLVLGGGEVTLLDHVTAYSTLANDGMKEGNTPILKVTDKDGNVLEQFKQSQGQRVVDEKYLGMLDYILSNNDLRAPVFGSNSPLRFDDRPVAAKTGTTNDFRDGWTIGYTPSLAAGVWTGNNDNSSMRTGSDGIVTAAPIWRSFMDQALKNYPIEQFPQYDKKADATGKPVIDGKTTGQDIKVCKMDKSKNGSKYCVANGDCPDGTSSDKKSFTDSHSILYYVDITNPLGPAPKDPTDDPQYDNWEKGVQSWLKDNNKDKSNSMPTTQCKAGNSSSDNSSSDNSSSSSSSTDNTSNTPANTTDNTINSTP
jgi:1A family penicillin-binding protein